LYLLWYGNGDILKFNSSGTFIKRINVSEIPNFPSTFDFSDVASIDRVIYLVDKANHLIHLFDSQLGYLTSTGGNGTSFFTFDSPKNIHYNFLTGRILVTDNTGLRVFKYHRKIFDFNVERNFIALGSDNLSSVNFSATFTAVGKTFVRIKENSTGQIVKNIKKWKQFG